MSKRMLGIAALSVLLHVCLLWWGPGLRWSARPAATAEPLALSLAAPQHGAEPAPALKSRTQEQAAQPKAAKPSRQTQQAQPAAQVKTQALQRQPAKLADAAAASNQLNLAENPAHSQEVISGKSTATRDTSQGEEGGEVIQAARYSAAYLNNPKPEVPYIAQRRCQSGLLKLRVWVSAAGKPVKVSVDKPSGCDAFDREALDTVKKDWRFEPAKRGSTAIESEVIVPMPLKILEQ